MNKLILAIILVLLLIPSMVSAEEQQYPPLIDEELKILDNANASYQIGQDMFRDVWKEYGVNYDMAAFFMAFGYKNLSEEVLKDVPSFTTDYGFALFYKHENKYKYHSSTIEMAFLSIKVLTGFTAGYEIGHSGAVLKYVKYAEKDIADTIPKMYEEYLEDKKKKQLKQKDDQIDSKGEHEGIVGGMNFT